MLNRALSVSVSGLLLPQDVHRLVQELRWHFFSWLPWLPLKTDVDDLRIMDLWWRASDIRMNCFFNCSSSQWRRRIFRLLFLWNKRLFIFVISSPVLQVSPGAAAAGTLGVSDGSRFRWQSCILGGWWARSPDRRRELLQPADVPRPHLPPSPGYRGTWHLSTVMTSSALILEPFSFIWTLIRFCCINLFLVKYPKLNNLFKIKLFRQIYIKQSEV